MAHSSGWENLEDEFQEREYQREEAAAWVRRAFAAEHLKQAESFVKMWEGLAAETRKLIETHPEFVGPTHDAETCEDCKELTESLARTEARIEKQKSEIAALMSPPA